MMMQLICKCFYWICVAYHVHLVKKKIEIPACFICYVKFGFGCEVGQNVSDTPVLVVEHFSPV